MRRKKKISAYRTGLIMMLSLLFVLSSGMLIRDLIRSLREQAANKALVRQAEQETFQDFTSSKSGSCSSASLPMTAPERNYLPLLQENSHLAAWLIIEDTKVDYPVLYTPDDPEYYLRKAFDGSYALSGSLFMGADSAPDGTNIIIYGHNMKDGTMFSSLLAYAAEDYAITHPEITYDLIQPDGSYDRLTFEVMAAFYSRVYTVEEEDVFRYYYGTDLSAPENFHDYVEEVMAASLYDVGVTAEYGDRLLTLSTCSDQTEDGRFVVVAREKQTSI